MAALTMRYQQYLRLNPGVEHANWHFVNWTAQKWREWRKMSGVKGEHLTPKDQAAFDEWLSTLAPSL